MKKSIKILIVILTSLFLFASNVYAEDYEAFDADPINQEVGDAEEDEEEIEVEPEEDDSSPEVGDTVTWTDFSKAKLEFEMGSSKILVHLKDITLLDNHHLTLIVSNSQTELQTALDEGKYTNLQQANFTKQDDGTYLSYINNEISSLNKDMYYAVVETTSSEKKVQMAVKKVDRPALPNYGHRLDIFFVYKEHLSVYQTVYGISSPNRKMKYKIGKITDVNLLKTFKTDEVKAFNNLYTYAKSDKGFYSGTAIVGDEQQANPITSLNIEASSYYYCYMEMDDENGKYLPIDDVAIYQGSTDGTILHFAFASMKIDESNPVENDPTVAKEPYPKTGAIVFGSIATLLLGSAVVFFIKNRELKDVK